MIDPKAREKLNQKVKTGEWQSVGEGYKWVADTQTDVEGICVGVVEKKPKFQLTKKELVPETIDGIATDVVETGKFYAQVPIIKPLAFDQRYRPCPGGVSGGHYKITTGTINPCWINGELYLLSNNHVMANSNNALIGDPVYQPGVYDGGRENDVIAYLSDFEPIKFNVEEDTKCSFAKFMEWLMNLYLELTKRTTRVRFYSQADNVNYIDAAIAKVISPDLMQDVIIKIGKIEGVGEAELGEKVQKSGRTTEYTTGEIIQKNVSVIVSYGDGLEAYFEKQLMTGYMSDGGDSGSYLLNMDRILKALLFAGSESNTIFSPIQPVIDTFGINFGGGL